MVRVARAFRLSEAAGAPIYSRLVGGWMKGVGAEGRSRRRRPRNEALARPIIVNGEASILPSSAHDLEMVVMRMLVTGSKTNCHVSRVSRPYIA